MLANKGAKFPGGTPSFLKETRGAASLTGSFDAGEGLQSLAPLRCELVELKETLESLIEKMDSVPKKQTEALAASAAEESGEISSLSSEVAMERWEKKARTLKAIHENHNEEIVPLEPEFVRRGETADVYLRGRALSETQERGMINKQEEGSFFEVEGADIKEVHEQMAAEIEKLRAELKEKKILLAEKEREEWRARGQSNKAWNGKLSGWIAKLSIWIVNGKRCLAQLLGSVPNALFLRKAVIKILCLLTKV